MAVKSVSTCCNDTLISVMRDIRYLKRDAEQLSTISKKTFTIIALQYQDAQTEVGDRRELAGPPIYRESCDLWAFSFSHPSPTHRQS